VDDATVETERKEVVWSLDLPRIRGDLRNHPSTGRSVCGERYYDQALALGANGMPSRSNCGLPLGLARLPGKTGPVERGARPPRAGLRLFKSPSQKDCVAGTVLIPGGCRRRIWKRLWTRLSGGGIAAMGRDAVLPVKRPTKAASTVAPARAPRRPQSPGNRCSSRGPVRGGLCVWRSGRFPHDPRCTICPFTDIETQDTAPTRPSSGVRRLSNVQIAGEAGVLLNVLEAQLGAPAHQSLDQFLRPGEFFGRQLDRGGVGFGWQRHP
jgi:hypothetical protein